MQVSKVFDPISFGADSTGAADSSDAIMNTINATFQAQQGKALLPGINDLGGAVVDLQGGNYKISKPIRLPSGGGNVVVIEACLISMLPSQSIAFTVHALYEFLNLEISYSDPWWNSAGR